MGRRPLRYQIRGSGEKTQRDPVSGAGGNLSFSGENVSINASKERALSAMARDKNSWKVETETNIAIKTPPSV